MATIADVLERYRSLPAAAVRGRNDVRAAVAQMEEETDLAYLLDNVPKALARSLDGLNRVATIVRSMKEFAHPDQNEMTPIDLNQAVQSTMIVARTEYKYVADVDMDLGTIPPITCFG